MRRFRSIRRLRWWLYRHKLVLLVFAAGFMVGGAAREKVYALGVGLILGIVGLFQLYLLCGLAVDIYRNPGVWKQVMMDVFVPGGGRDG